MFFISKLYLNFKEFVKSEGSLGKLQVINAKSANIDTFRFHNKNKPIRKKSTKPIYLR